MTTSSQFIEAAQKRWMERLIDVSRNNNLLYYRPLKTGTLDLRAAEPAALRELLAGKKVQLSDLLRPVSDAELRARVSAIRKRALANTEEKGLETLFLAFGAATWTVTDSGRAPSAPVVLLPTSIQMRGASQTLQVTGAPQINLALLHVLQSEFGVTVAPGDLLPAADDEAGESATTGLSPGGGNVVFDRLRQAARRVPGFDVLPSVVLGNFSFQKMAMVRDIRENGQRIAEHGVLAAMAGVPEARTALLRERRDVQLRELDQTRPDDEHLVMLADSSQQRVIAMAARPQSGVIQGPPGTGKSQTIVNLIASLAAQGKRVLFVAEKRAALQVVKDRMESVGLGHLVLDLHGADISSREVYARIADSLEAVREVPPVRPADVHRRFVERRDYLNKHVARLHTQREPHKRSVYDLQGDLLAHGEQTLTATRWRGADLDRMTADVLRQLREVLTEARGVPALFLRTANSPWVNAQITSGTLAQQAQDAARAIDGEHAPDLDRLLPQVCGQTGLRLPETVTALLELGSLLDEADNLQQQYALAVFGEDLDAFGRVIGGANSKAKQLWARMTNPAYRRAMRTLRAHHAAPLSDDMAHDDVKRLLGLRNRWRSAAANESTVQLPTDSKTLGSVVRQLAVQFGILQRVLSDSMSEKVPWAEARTVCARLAADGPTALQIPRVRELEAQMDKLGAAALLRELARRDMPPVEWAKALDHAVAASLLDRARAETPELAAFSGTVHEQQVREFCDLDEKRTQLAVQRVKRTCAEHVVAVRNQFADENVLVKTQAGKKRGQIQLRELLARAPHVLTALFPCWMASPLSISQLLKADQCYFDVVLFDEASQVLPEDAVPAILRAEHVIVAGDRHQLPPTTFFASGAGDADEESDDADGVDGFESLLDVMTSMTEQWSLDWHYRSKDESLIAFSNRHIYGDRLITFPGIGSGKAIRHELVNLNTLRDGQEDSASDEVQRVVELVLEHARSRPDRSLGVITMGIAHANRVEAAVERALDREMARDPAIEAFFDTRRMERFFVKNLERVQGDERDAIIISIGYGKDASGRLAYRFGPLLTAGGERRLNVAVTRARHSLTLVSSFDHRDMDPNRSKARGIELLRLYLEYAASNGRFLGQSSGSSGVPLNPFELDVRDALTAKGMRLTPQWGVSGYRIDFVAAHPERPGDFVLAIECDGASYHSAATARDRDRLRQQVLESLGWKFHRIWSTDWFNHREREIERALSAYRDAASRPSPAAARSEPGVTLQKDAPVSVATVATPRERPNVPVRGSIDDYSDAELRQLARWVRSDGRLRDDNEMFDAVFELLPFKRRGRKIDERIQAAIVATRQGGARA